MRFSSARLKNHALSPVRVTQRVTEWLSSLGEGRWPLGGRTNRCHGGKVIHGPASHGRALQERRRPQTVRSAGPCLPAPLLPKITGQSSPSRKLPGCAHSKALLLGQGMDGKGRGHSVGATRTDGGNTARVTGSTSTAQVVRATGTRFSNGWSRWP